MAATGGGGHLHPHMHRLRKAPGVMVNRSQALVRRRTSLWLTDLAVRHGKASAQGCIASRNREPGELHSRHASVLLGLK